jgi:hypothetical protein
VTHGLHRTWWRKSSETFGITRFPQVWVRSRSCVTFFSNAPLAPPPLRRRLLGGRRMISKTRAWPIPPVWPPRCCRPVTRPEPRGAVPGKPRRPRGLRVQDGEQIRCEHLGQQFQRCKERRSRPSRTVFVRPRPLQAPHLPGAQSQPAGPFDLRHVSLLHLLEHLPPLPLALTHADPLLWHRASRPLEERTFLLRTNRTFSLCSDRGGTFSLTNSGGSYKQDLKLACFFGRLAFGCLFMKTRGEEGV